MWIKDNDYVGNGEKHHLDSICISVLDAVANEFKEMGEKFFESKDSIEINSLDKNVFSLKVDEGSFTSEVLMMIVARV